MSMYSLNACMMGDAGNSWVVVLVDVVDFPRTFDLSFLCRRWFVFCLFHRRYD